MEKVAKIFARNLKAYRQKIGLTQEKLAERMGVSHITVQNWERGRRWPHPDSIDDLARDLEIDPAFLFIENPKNLHPTIEEAWKIVGEYLKQERNKPKTPR